MMDLLSNVLGHIEPGIVSAARKWLKCEPDVNYIRQGPHSLQLAPVERWVLLYYNDQARHLWVQCYVAEILGE